MTPSEQKRRRDPEKVRADKARWYQKHKAEIAAKTAARIAANPEKKRAWNAKWRAENAEHKKAYHKAHHAANPEQLRLRVANRRARVGAGRLSAGLTQKLFKLQRGLCACCAAPLGDSYHLDHIMPLALGGSNTDSNMQLLRDKCNWQKAAKHPVDFMQSRGFLL